MTAATTTLLDDLRTVLGHPLPPPLPWDEATEARMDNAAARADEGWVSDDDAARMQAREDDRLMREA